MDPEDQSTAGVIAPPPLIFAGPLALGIGLQKEKSLRFLPPTLARPLGLLLALGGLALAVFGGYTMRKAGTNINPTQPTTALVTSGPFRFSRNPLYLSMLLIYLGLSSLANSLWPIVQLPLV